MINHARIPDEPMKTILGWNIYLFSVQKADGRYGIDVPAACQADADAAIAEVYPEAVYDGVLHAVIPWDREEGAV
jgi:hypothetical protein